MPSDIDVHHVGDVVRIEGTFYDFEGDLTDPATIELKVMNPSGNVVTKNYPTSPQEIERESAGNFYAQITVDQPGEWHFFWTSTGAGGGGEPGQFTVEPKVIP